MVTLKPSDFRSAYNNQINFDHLHKNQVNRVNFDAYSDIKSILMPRHKNRVNFVTDTRTSHFRPPHKNQVYSDPYTEIKSISTKHTTQSISTLLSTLHWNQVRFHPPHWNQVHFDHPHKSRVNFDAHTKTKWFTAHIQKPSQFRPPTQNQVSWSTHKKWVIFGPRTKKQVNFDPYTLNQGFSRCRTAPRCVFFCFRNHTLHFSAVFIFWEAYGAVRCGFHFFKIIRCGAMRFFSLTVRRGAD